MPDSLRATMGQLSCAGGRWQARAANVRAVEPARDHPAAERGSLYMLVEVVGSGGGHAALYRQLLNAAQAAYYEKGETVESALRHAVRRVHMEIREANDALPEARWRGGISLAARVEGHLVTAQAGPSLILVGHADRVDQFPDKPDATGPGLGGPERPEVVISRTRVEQSSMVLLLESEWPKKVAPKSLAAAAFADSVPLATEYLGTLAGEAELSALLVGLESVIPEVVDDGPVTLTPVREPEAAAGKGGLFGGMLGHKPRAASTPEFEAVAPAVPTPADASPAPVLPVTTPVMPQPKPKPAPQAKSKPKPALATDAEGEPRQRSTWPMLVALVILPILIGLVVLAMLLVRGRQVQAQVGQLLDSAETAITEVETLPEDVAGPRLQAANELLGKARVLDPDNERLDSLQLRFDENQARVQKVTPLYGIVPLWPFKEPGQMLDRVLVSGDSIFVLDRGRNEILRFIRSSLGDSVTPADKSALRKGDQVGNAPVSDLVDITWAEAVGTNQRSKLLALDSSGGLLGYDVTWGAERLTIGGREKWIKPGLVTSYGGNFYVVDVDGDQIWRHRPKGNGYEGEPEGYFVNAGMVDMAGIQSVAIDGSVWLLYGDGRLLKFFNSEQRPFELRGLPDPLNGPVAIAAPLESDRVYIVDAGNARIVEATKDGAFLRQFRAREGNILRDVRALFLDEQGAMFYILTSDQLYKANLPAPAAPLAPASTPAN